MSTYTPGPWRKGDHVFDIVAGDYTVVATAAHDRQGLNRGRETSLANAQLIAMTPDLLAELKDLTERFYRCCLHSGSSPDFAAEAVQRPRDLIARAEGRMPNADPSAARSTGDDDGVEYGDPRDRREGR